MKSRKVFLPFIALGLAVVAPFALAQEGAPKAPPAQGGGGGQRGPGGGGGRGQQTPEQQIERLETAVGKLTDDQKTKITAVYAKVAKDMAALAQEDRRTKGMELRAAAQKEVRALLTEEQAKKFDAMPQGGRGQGGGPGGGGAKKGN